LTFPTAKLILTRSFTEEASRLRIKSRRTNDQEDSAAAARTGTASSRSSVSEIIFLSFFTEPRILNKKIKKERERERETEMAKGADVAEVQDDAWDGQREREGGGGAAPRRIENDDWW